ncbi:cytochrome c3 family protein [Thermodesulfobacteriota bacterium]
MNKRILALITITLILLSSTHLFAAETAADEISGSILIDILADAKTEGVVLKHKKHASDYKVACNECHHTFNPGEDASPKPCLDCHDFSELKMVEGKRIPLIRSSILKNIYHDSCKNCHEKLKRKGISVNKKCSTCHPLRIK